MICTSWDAYMESRMEGNVIWMVKLDDNTVVLDDGERSGRSAWLNLKDYCISNGRKIKEMKLRFRSHYEGVPHGKNYMFVKSVLGHLMGPQMEYNIIGVEQDDFKIYKFKTPELILELVESRDIEQYKDLLIPGL